MQFPSEMRQAPDCCARGGFPFIAFLVELLPLFHWSWGLLGDKWLLWRCHLHPGLSISHLGKAEVNQTLPWDGEGRAEQPHSGQWRGAGGVLNG